MPIPLLASPDVAVIGGGTAGTIAAIAAARGGANTLLIERGGFLGGTSTGGLVNSYVTFYDADGRCVVGGIGREVVERLRSMDAATEYLENSMGGCPQIFFDPETLKYVLQEMLEEAGARLMYHSYACDVVVENDVLKGIIIQNKSGRQRIAPRVSVDATGDADVAALAGAPFDQEPRDRLQAVSLVFKMGGVDVNRLIAYIKRHSQQFVLGVAAKDLGRTNMVGTRLEYFPAWRKAIENRELPEGILVGQGCLMTWDLDMDRNQVTTNATRLDSVDATDVTDLSNAEIKLRKQVMAILAFYRKNLPGFERAYLLETAPQLGIRETRRVVGEYTLTQEDVLNAVQFDDGIGKGATPIDIHGGPADGAKQYWVETHRKGIRAYDIPYRSLVPKIVDNLLVAGRCISATHEAQGAIRMMPVCLVTGQAAGLAAALAANERVPPRNLDVRALKRELEYQGQLLALP
jgi:hypothetical protein